MIRLLFLPALWSLLGLLLIIWFYRRRRCQHKIVVASIEIWRRLPGGIPLRQPTPWLRWRLLLALLAYTLIGLALAAPVWQPGQRQMRSLLLVIDSSASMQTKIGQQRVFAKAIARVQHMLDHLDERDQVTLIAYPPRQSCTGSVARVRARLSRLRCSTIASDFRQFWASLANTQVPIYFFSDGAAAFTPLPAMVIPIFLGEQATDNSGIVAWKILRRSRQRDEVFAVIRNFSTSAQSLILELQKDSQVASRQNLTLKRQQRYAWSSAIIGPWQTLSLHLREHSDNFSLDDHAGAVNAPVFTIWLASEAPRSFRAVLRSLPGVEIVSDRGAAEWQLVPLAADRGHRAWLLYRRDHNPTLAYAGWQPPGQIVVHAAPLLQAVTPELLHIERGLPLRPPLPGRPLLTTAAGPILAVGADWLYLGFCPERSFWPKLPTFPIFWDNVFRYWQQRHRYWQPLSERHRLPGIVSEAGRNLAFSLVNESESDNRGQLTPPISWPPPPGNASPRFQSLETITILIAIVVLLLLWYLESRRGQMVVYGKRNNRRSREAVHKAI